jgi:BA14K-like protein
MTRKPIPMLVVSAVAAAAVVIVLGVTAASAQDLGLRPLRYGNTSPWSYDNRDDPRDYPTNGFFPGNYTADPSTAWLGISGALAGNSYRSPYPYPSQVVIGPAPYQPACVRLRTYDPASGTYLGRDGLRHRC